MSFFKKLLNSIYSPAFYAKIPQQSSGSAIGYFALLVLLLTVIQTGTIFFSANLPNIQNMLQTSINKAVMMYPTALTITIRNGVVSTNVKEPYIIPLPGGPSEGKNNLLVIDTKTPFSTTDFRKYSTYLWLTKDSIFMAGDSQMRTVDLSQIKDFTLNKNLVTSIAKELSPWLNVVTPLLTVFFLVCFYIIYFCRLVYLFFLALLIFVLGKLMKKSVAYMQAYRIGIYAMTTAFFVELFAPFIKLNQIPFLFTIISLAVVFVNFLNMPKTKPAQSKTKPSKKIKKN